MGQLLKLCSHPGPLELTKIVDFPAAPVWVVPYKCVHNYAPNSSAGPPAALRFIETD